ncbi:MAG: hypothetical protein JW804_01020 [Sedimentisphaerales bacterium]|nr:hypothetical protein [Sedimentisphaerales bacterium]
MKLNLTYLRIIIAAFAIGLLANTAGPASSRAGIERKTRELADNLVKIRSSLELYRVHHMGRYPPSGSFEKFEAALRTKSETNAWYINGVPANPFNGLNTVRFDNEPAGAKKAGYKFDPETGAFQADNDPAYSAL